MSDNRLFPDEIRRLPIGVLSGDYAAQHTYAALLSDRDVP
jgi:hypothetical protein